jgi:hypothetical protein
VVAVVLTLLFAASRIVITEVMANPKGKSGAHAPEDRNEFIELLNVSPQAVDLYDWQIDDGDSKDRLVAWTDSAILRPEETLRINQTWLNPGCYAVILDSEYTDPNPIGGLSQPYHFGSGCLILTVRNTTLGNGLATTDPVTLTSGYGDTSTFGTPWDLTDSFPHDAGDGISWERIDSAGPDTVTNWLPCPDSCTPGAVNRAGTCVDLALVGLDLVGEATPLASETARVVIACIGAPAGDSCSLVVFLDRDGDGHEDAGERVFESGGWALRRGQDTTLAVPFQCPAANTDLWAEVSCPNDRDSSNNSMRLTIMPGGSGRMFDLNLSSFSPDRDGFEDSLAVLYRLPAAYGTLDIAVYDLAGRKVAALLSGHPPAAGGAAYWDGRNTSGSPVPPGVYAVCVEHRYRSVTRTDKLPVVLWRK